MRASSGDCAARQTGRESWEESEVKRYAMTVLLKDDPLVIRKYERCHAKVWPEVIAGNVRCGVLRSFIFRQGRQLFMFMETRDDFDMKRDMAKYMEHPRAREWDKMMTDMQVPVTGAPKGSKWIQMRELFGFEAGRQVTAARRNSRTKARTRGRRSPAA